MTFMNFFWRAAENKLSTRPKGFHIFFITTWLFFSTAAAWNANGHRLIAAIAYNHLSANAKQEFLNYEKALSPIYKPLSWTDSAVWLDNLRYQDIHWFDALHYMDMPFSNDGSKLPEIQEYNALWGIDAATQTLSSPYAKPFDKGVALRILIHVVGDLHQPLHVATRVSKVQPKGDMGGNLLPLRNTRIAKNLHAYWDKGGGSLLFKHRLHEDEVRKKAQEIERKFPCHETNSQHARAWALESHHIAWTIAYKELPKNHKLDKKYQQLTETITAERIALAGCRLASLLNQIHKRISNE